MLRFLVCLFGLTLSICAHAVEPRNLDTVKHDLMQYQSSGQYLNDQKTITDQAMAYLKAHLQGHQTKPLAIVFDIDETVLSNYHDMVTLNFGGTFDEIAQQEGKGTDPAIEPTLALYRFARDHKIAIFFITGRTEPYRAATVKNLKAAGFTEWDGLILKPETYHEKTASIYKTNARKSITDKGYEILMNIGDQESDLAGGYADQTFKLPNPYYFIP